MQTKINSFEKICILSSWTADVKLAHLQCCTEGGLLDPPVGAMSPFHPYGGALPLSEGINPTHLTFTPAICSAMASSE